MYGLRNSARQMKIMRIKQYASVAYECGDLENEVVLIKIELSAV